METKNLTFPGGLILGVGLLYLLARCFARRKGNDSSTSTALDIDMPNYAWLR